MQAQNMDQFHQPRYTDMYFDLDLKPRSLKHLKLTQKCQVANAGTKYGPITST